MHTGPRLAFVFLFLLVPGLLSIQAAPADSLVADASMRGDIDQVEALLARGADVQTARADGMTALHWAARRSDVDLAEMLIYLMKMLVAY